MNPLTNRWGALLVAAVILFIVAELADDGGVLSQYAANAPAPEVATASETAAAETAATDVEDQPQQGFAEDADEEDGLQPDEDPYAIEDGAEAEGDSSEGDDAESAEPGTSIASDTPPGPPGIFNGE